MEVTGKNARKNRRAHRVEYIEKIDLGLYIQEQKKAGNMVRCLVFDSERGVFRDATVEDVARHPRVSHSRVYRNDQGNTIALLERPTQIEARFFHER